MVEKKYTSEPGGEGRLWRVERKPDSNGLLIHYDFRGSSPPVSPLPKLERRDEPVQTLPEVERGSFADRVVSRRVNLVKIIEDGLPLLDFLPGSDEMLIRGKRHTVAAPAKDGKSLAMLVHVVDMVLEGAVVAILDRENGTDTYARRLADIMKARRLTSEQRAALGQRLAYHEFPSLSWTDEEALAAYCRGVDLVVFDSQRMFLSDLGLKEDASDDYAQFMAALIDPLFLIDVATLVLDNTGHSDKKRGRGTSSKGDLNEIVFSLEKTTAFDLYNAGLVTLRVEKTRFGNTGEWTMKLGGGQYGSWVSGTPAKPRPEFEAATVAALMKVKHPLGMNRLIEEARRCGVSIGTAKARDLLSNYVADPTSPIGYVAGTGGKDTAGYVLIVAPETGGATPAPETGGAARRDDS